MERPIPGLYIAKAGIHSFIFDIIDLSVTPAPLIVYHLNRQYDKEISALRVIKDEEAIVYLQERIPQMSDDHIAYIDDQVGARNRLNQVVQEDKNNPLGYNVMYSNCENFAYFVAIGEWRTPMVETVAELAGALTAIAIEGFSKLFRKK